MLVSSLDTFRLLVDTAVYNLENAVIEREQKT